MQSSHKCMQLLKYKATSVCVCNAWAISCRLSHKVLARYPALLTGKSVGLCRQIQTFGAPEFQRRTRRQRELLMTEMKRMAWKTHNCRMGKAWRCATLEKASSLLLPWQWSLLGNYVAMARVSSVMQTWPHPPTSSPVVNGRAEEGVGGKRGGSLAVCQWWEQTPCVCLCMRVCVCFFGVFFSRSLSCVFSFRLLILASTVQCCSPVSLLPAPLTHDPSSFQGVASFPGAGTNMGCVETVHRPTSLSLSSYLVSDLFSLAVELDTLWQCAPWQLARD